MEIDLSHMKRFNFSIISAIAGPVLALGALMCAGFEAYSLPASAFATTSRMGQGHWVKVEVDTTGVYAISYEQLRQWGFDNPETVGVYGTGAVVTAEHDFDGDLPDDLPQLTVMHTDDRVVFYAEGSFRAVPTADNKALFKRNLYDNHSYYFLSDCGEPLTSMPETPYNGNPDSKDELDRSWAISVIEPEEHNPGMGGAQYFSHPIPVGTQRSFVLNVADMTHRRNGDARVGYINIDYIFNQNTDGMFSPEVTISSPWTMTAPNLGSTSKQTSTVNFGFRSGYFNFSCSKNLPQNITIKYTVPESFTGDFWCVDRVYAIYTRLNRLGNDNWRMLNIGNVAAGDPVVIAEAPQNLQVWNVTNPMKPSRLLAEQREDGSAVVSMNKGYDTNNPAQILIFDSAANLPTPAYAGEVANQNLHGDTEIPDMLIVTTASMAQYAQQLADIHAATRNLRVSVVNQNDVFNEFSSGSRCPQGIRRYIKMLYDRDSDGRFRYVLLYGATQSDNRFIEHAQQDVLVCMQAEENSEVNSNSTNYCADAYFGIVGDNSRVQQLYVQQQQLSVGRLPVRTPEQATGINAKIQRYITHPVSAATAMRACFVSDLDPSTRKDDHLQHNDTARAFISRARPDMVFETIDLIRYSSAEYKNATIAPKARKRFTDNLRNGCNLVWYSGHGGHNSFSLTEVMKSSHMVALANSEYPWGVFSTCLLGDFDVNPGCLLECAVLNPNGGLMGATGSGREVYLTYNEWLNLFMAQGVASAEPGTTLADILREARNRLNSDNSQSSTIQRGRNAMCYNFVGDPSLPLHFSSGKIDIQTIDGVAPATASVPSTITGAITTVTANIAGAGAANFNGAGQLRVFAPRTYTNMKPDTQHTNYNNTTWLGSLEHTFVSENVLLAEYPVEVVSGAVSTSFVLPVTEADSARIYIYARDNASGALASGHSYVHLRKGSGSAPSQGAPVFENAYIDSPDFVNGDIIQRPVNVLATVRGAQAGVVMAVTGVANVPECILDGTTNLAASLSCLYNQDGLLEIKCALPKLSDGAHSVALKVSDFAGNTVSRTLDFVVDSQPLTATLGADAAVARTGIELTIEDVPANAEVTMLTVSDAAGNTVRTFANPVFPLRWNLTDAAGRAVPDGEYKVDARLRRGNSYGSTPQLSFTVIGL